jgi:hypothetical protein
MSSNRARFVDRPDCERAFAFDAGLCGDPSCGLHVIPSRRNGAPICEIIIGRKQLLALLDLIHEAGLDVPQ